MRSRESSKTKRGDIIDSLVDIKNQKLSQGEFSKSNVPSIQLNPIKFDSSLLNRIRR